MSYTKGEWYTNELRDIVFCKKPDGEIVEIVDLTFPTKLPASENKDNARLIAAAPKLLAACKLYQERIELLYELNPDVKIALGAGLGLKQVEDKGKAAIAKAEKTSSG